MSAVDITGRLEEIIDRYDLEAVIDALAAVGYAKAEHIRQSYGDNLTAKWWEERAEAIANLLP